MHNKRLKFFSVVLSASMVMSSVIPAASVFAIEGEEQQVQELQEENESKKAKTATAEGETIRDDFNGDELDSEWINSAGSVTWSKGKLNLAHNSGTVSSIQRKIGTGSFETELHWENYSADTSGNNSVMIYRVSDGSDQNLAEIQRFSNGQLHLLVINEGKQQDFTTKSDFAATEGWFKISYDNNTKKIYASYKTAEDTEYQEMNGSGTSMTKYSRKHVAEIRAQKWGGSTQLSVDVTQFNVTASFNKTVNLNLKSDNMNVVVDEETGGIF